MALDKCMVCEKRISRQNNRNLQCQNCKRFCHPNCSRFLPRLCLERKGNFRFTVVRNRSWTCEICSLKELPFYDISKKQLKDIIKTENTESSTIPSVDELNAILHPKMQVIH